ncbi:MAG: hypothetical protein CME88_14920 [Hirschia sp.]|nr:hypothetical protein [Hirschia sp.]MBF19668.1 hypothetical protein [Hirschia sp.]|tara:strand:- start:93 stop:437 length:345 start_codon:yes stop_codon:yes gene_type:complete
MKKQGLLDRVSTLFASRPEPTPASIAAQAEITRRERRGGDRVNTYKDTTLYLTGNRRKRAIIRDMSETGLRIACDGSISLPDYVDISVFNDRYTCHVVWRTPFEVGLEYCAVEA